MVTQEEEFAQTQGLTDELTDEEKKILHDTPLLEQVMQSKNPMDFANRIRKNNLEINVQELVEDFMQEIKANDGDELYNIVHEVMVMCKDTLEYFVVLFKLFDLSYNISTYDFKGIPMIETIHEIGSLLHLLCNKDLVVIMLLFDNAIHKTRLLLFCY